MVVDAIAGLSVLFVIYRMAREASYTERVGGVTGVAIGAVCCVSQWKLWPTGCTAPFTEITRPCGPVDGHPRIIITLAIIMVATWSGGTVAKMLQGTSKKEQQN